MNPAVVVDIGNTRIKWGQCGPDRVLAVARLSPEWPDEWRRQIDDWQLSPKARFFLAGVHPARLQSHADWLRSAGFVVNSLSSYQQLSLTIQVEHPERVGLDRLLNAVAANAVRKAGQSVFAVDAGSAVTVDWIDAEGVFRGGAIYPGLRLMAEALHQYTARLPLVEVKEAAAYPGTSTERAITCGIVAAVAGAVEKLAANVEGELILTGGDGPVIQKALKDPVRLWPEMTLEGIRLANRSDSELNSEVTFVDPPR